MNKYIQQSIYIVLISVFLSIIRYLFIEDDYDLLKRNKIKNESTEIENFDIENLRIYLDNISSPQIVSLSNAKRIYDNNLATFIDARSEDEFMEGHIKNAINIPYELIKDIEKSYDLIWMNQLEEDYMYTIENISNELIFGINDKKKIIRNPENYDTNDEIMSFETIFLIYCSGEGCSLSEDLSFYMHEELNFKKILIYEGGMPEWIKSNYPVE